MIDRRQAGSGQMRRGGRATQSAASSSEPSLAALGADLLYHWEASAGTVTLNGSNVSSFAERVAGTANLAQGTAGNQPAYNASGGPNDLPWIEIQDANRFLSATIAIAAGNRACLYVVGKTGGNNGFICWRLDHNGGGQTRLGNNATQWVPRIEFTGGTASINVTSPARDTDWHLFALRPLATGALSQIDGATTTPNFASSNALLEIVGIRLGFSAGSSDAGTGVQSMIIVDNADAAKDTIVKTYVNQVTGLTLA